MASTFLFCYKNYANLSKCWRHLIPIFMDRQFYSYSFRSEKQISDLWIVCLGSVEKNKIK